jgi:lipopolysaccharide transport system permease protein
VNKKPQLTIITNKRKRFNLNIGELLKYRDLISLFVKRNLKTRYKQTILGPLWYIIQPLLSTLIYTLIFGTLARDITDGSVPAYLFYMAGNVPWIFFSSCLTGTSSVFTSNAKVFTKVYFPRLTVPYSTVITNAFGFLIQFLMFLAFELAYFIMGASVQITWVAALTPIFIIQLAMLAMGIGLIISSFTAKYRDLAVLVGFISTVWMYLTPVVYEASGFGAQTLAYKLIMLNPVSPVIEAMRFGWLGSGGVSWIYYGISVALTFIILLIGTALFNRVERNFADTV